jgi:hypothetical protein
VPLSTPTRGAALDAAQQQTASLVEDIPTPVVRDLAGDAFYPAEIARAERLRRIRNWQEQRRARYELAKRRKLDEAIDKLLATRAGALGERPEAEIPESHRTALADAVSAVQPLKPFRPQPAAPPTPLGDQLRAAATIALPAQERPETAYLQARLAAYTADHQSQRNTALAQFATLADQTQGKDRGAAMQQLLSLPTKPARLSPDQLLAALAQGQREMARIRGY